MSSTQNVDVTLQTVAPSQSIIKRIANLEGVDFTELDPLYNVIDPDALNTLVGATEQSDSTLKIEFTYHDYDVAVTGNGTIYINEDVPFEK